MEGEQDPRTYAIIGAAMEVHQHLGHGFLEPVYQEAMAIELGLVAIPFQKEVELDSDRSFSAILKRVGSTTRDVWILASPSEGHF